MSRPIAPALFALSAALLAASAGVADADEQRFANEVRGVLTAGWGPSFRQLEPAAAAYARATKEAASDARAPFALALVQIKHRRYDDALGSVAQTLRLDPRNLSAHQADIFLTMLLKQHQAALTKLDRLASLLEEQAANDDANPKPLADAARFMGQMFGYLGTSAGEAPKVEVAAAQDQVVKRLPAPSYEAFELGRKAVDEQFTELFLDREQQQQDAQDAETQARIATAQELQTAKELLEGERAQLEQARKSAISTLEQAEAALTTARGPVVEKLATLQRSLIPLENQMAQLDARIGQCLSLAASERDPQQSFAYRVEADQLTGLLQRYQFNYRALRAQAAPLEAELATIDAKRKAARDQYASQTRLIAGRGVEVVEAEKKVATRWERNQRPVVGNTAAVSSRSAQVKALTTYYAYPLEQERLKLLESLGD